ncbi:cytochrome-c peroxidase [Collimonas sp.]|jgi:cytochrome c peroxidase|uniref:cytochrome-c peroxidase n=1 Tax=Collimonas sp. TaxID=1963772 RepID=UPI002C8D63EB|nr:cytochrome c peroxidase [Collimonas sp.]HWW08568.1 cytochrome c peroxidase [Collimonas sp.]
MKIRFQPHPARAVPASPHTAILLLATLMFLLSACNRQDKAGTGIAPAAVAPTVAPAAAPVTPLPATTAQAALARLNAPVAPLSAVAEIGKKIFYDKSLSASGKLSCASCHNPDNAHAPANGLAVQLGGMHLQAQGGRAVPSLRYHEHAPAFSIGPDSKPDEDDKGALLQVAAAKVSPAAPAVAKATLQPAAAVQEVVPQGGFDWDGRASNLTDQAGGPLLAANEMANKSAAQLLAKLKAAPYASDMLQLFGPAVFTSSNLALGEAYYALALYQKEDRSFHPYDSKYDYYLAEKVQLSEQEMRGLKLFKDTKKGNCATCHSEKPSHNGRFPPVFTDYQFEALAAPRNQAILANRDPRYVDLGMCGPWRKDMAEQLNYCGYFKTPTLRNVATRQVYFHNGVFHSLEEVVRFYVERETQPEKWYSRDQHGKLKKYDDLPAAYHANVDVTDAPFDSKPGAPPALTDDEIKDVVAFLKTLNDGYRPEKKQIPGK